MKKALEILGLTAGLGLAGIQGCDNDHPLSKESFQGTLRSAQIKGWEQGIEEVRLTICSVKKARQDTTKNAIDILTECKTEMLRQPETNTK
jgi:hypothetical protein